MRFETEQRPDEDASFADAIGRAGRVLLFEGGYDDEQPKRQPAPDRGGDLVLHTLRQPLPAFAKAASGLAPFPLPGTRQQGLGLPVGRSPDPSGAGAADVRE